MATAAPEIGALARDQAFETLYRHYVKDVYHYALALLRNPADAEDVTQTTFLNAYRAYQRGIEVEKPQNWLIKIAHNAARTRYDRAGRRVREVPLEDHVEQLAVPEAERPDVTGVLQALGRLPFNQRAALVMREFEGRSYIEISDTIGVSVAAVETLIFRARKSLRLKASTLRALGAVPLPTSLTQFFDGGGGVVAGGGAALGTGFLVKAAVALVAGVVATGIGGDRSGSDAAAAGSLPALATELSWHGADGFMARPLRSSGVKQRRIDAWERVRDGSMRSTVGPKHASHWVAPAAAPRQANAEASPGSADAGTSPAAARVPQLPAQVSSLTDTVEQAAATVTSVLPVQAPNLPPVSVQIPPLPLGNSLP